MKVLFVKDEKGVAKAGDIKDVSDGYARNYLIPHKVAVPATPAEIKKVEERRKSEERRQQREETELRTKANEIDGKTVTVRAKVGEQDRLYGSITAGDIAEAIKRELNQEIDRRKIEVAEPIRHLGEHAVTIQFAWNIAAQVKVRVEKAES